jgi:hypothetical protein
VTPYRNINPKPGAVVICALSAVPKGPSEERAKAARDSLDRLKEVVARDRLPLGTVAMPKDRFREFLKARQLREDIGDTNWLTNLVAVYANRAAIEKVVVVPSKESAANIGEFIELVETVWANSAVGRKLEVLALEEPVDYED